MIQRASSWTLAEVAAATGGERVGDGEVRLAGVSTDTRDALAGQLFVALAGDRFDAHDFLLEAEARGAAGLLVSRAGLEKSAGARGLRGPRVVVDDTLQALGDLAAAHRRRLGKLVLALTGSNGKTTTKEMIAAILSVSRRVLKTEGNLNNLIGVPMTLLGLSGDHDLAVVEMGMNQKGEIARYAEIATPDLGLVLNVGPAHIGLLGSLAAIGDAKGELFFGLDRTRGVAVVNADDAEVVRVARASGVREQRTFGKSRDADVALLEYTPVSRGGAPGGRARYAVDGVELELELPIAGAHNAVNAAAAIAAVTAPAPGLRPATFEEIAEGVSRAAYVARRMVFEPIGPFVVVDDCYNANSASMLAAIETVRAHAAAAGVRFVALLGEIRELGAFAAQEHREVGAALVRARPALVAAFGALAAPIAEVVRAGGIEAEHEPDDLEALWRWLRPRLQPGDIILVKGSRGMAMERFIARIREEAG